MSDPAVRILIVVLALASAITHSWWIGDQWLKSPVPVTFGRLSFTALFLVIAVTQKKAARLEIPVDGFTWSLVAALALSTLSFGWAAVQGSRR